MTALTSDIAKFVTTLQASSVPPRCNFGARIGMLDCVGTMIAGADEPAVKLVAQMVPASTSNDGAPEIPGGRNLSAGDAALVNGVAAHVLDYDDVGMDGHPSAALTPAILAEGWTLGSSGEDALAAYVAGYEVWALLQELEPGALHERGFHPTAIWGTLSAAAACARLNRLDADGTTNAIAIAASLAAGTVANFGTMTKSLHAGRTAQSGVLAARLAKSGFTASPDVLEHKAGFMAAHSAAGNPAVTRGDWGLGSNWRLEQLGINIKRYPMCYATHRAIDAMLDLAAEHDLDPKSIDEIHVRIGNAQDLMLRNRAPKTALEAKFSIEFAMASALIARRVGLKELDDEFVRRDDIVDIGGLAHIVDNAHGVLDRRAGFTQCLVDGRQRILRLRANGIWHLHGCIVIARGAGHVDGVFVPNGAGIAELALERGACGNTLHHLRSRASRSRPWSRRRKSRRLPSSSRQCRRGLRAGSACARDRCRSGGCRRPVL